MNKRILVAVATAGCISRFRSGMQFTKTAKEVLVDENELALLKADSYLKVDVISNDADNTGEGADNDDAGKTTVDGSTSSVNDASLKDDTNTATSSDESNTVVDELEDKPTPKADAGADTDTDDEAKTDDTEGTDGSEDTHEHLDVIVEAMRGLNLDMTADKPTVKQLKDLGLDVSAKERDDAWDVLVAEHTESIPE